MPFPADRPRRLRQTAGLAAPDARDRARRPTSHPAAVRRARHATRRAGAEHARRCAAVRRSVADEAKRAARAGVPGVLLFGVPDDKDPTGQRGDRPERPRAAGDPRHQGAGAGPSRVGGRVPVRRDRSRPLRARERGGRRCDNDESLPVLARVAAAYAAAGADAVAPSDMMDGRVAAIRRELDAQGLSHVPIVSYAAKYASAFYGPFREAAGLRAGVRRPAQLSDGPGERREAVREVLLDLEEGADIVMVKPAGPYLDVVRRVRDAVRCPVAAYQVSGEYSMIKAAAQRGLDRRACGRARDAHGHPARGRGHHHHLLREGCGRCGSRSRRGEMPATARRRVDSVFLAACRGESMPYTPVWIMRQAGRYLPGVPRAARALRLRDAHAAPRCGGGSDAAAAAPFRLDAAILFSDIMTPLQGMGVSVEFTPGPVIAAAAAHARAGRCPASARARRGRAVRARERAARPARSCRKARHSSASRARPSRFSVTW